MWLIGSSRLHLVPRDSTDLRTKGGIFARMRNAQRWTVVVRGQVARGPEETRATRERRAVLRHARGR